jgi:thymidine kinase
MEINLNETRVKLVSISGNIGSGKSTIIKKIKEIIKDDPRYEYVREPVDDWESIKDENGNGILKVFYENQKNTAFTFQMCALGTRMKVLKNSIDIAKKRSIEMNIDVIIIIERTLLDDFHIFAKMHNHCGNISMLEMNVYKMWFDTFTENFKLYACIYVETLPEICYERLLKRSRNAENGVQLEYLLDCHDYHLDFYNNILINNNCLKVNNSNDILDDEYQTMISKILEHFLK